MRAPMLKSWLECHVHNLVQLARLRFDHKTHERYLAAIGWTATRKEWWPETTFKVHFGEIDRDLIAVYKESETRIAIGLYALTSERVTYDFAIASRTEFDSEYDEILATIAPLLPDSSGTGTYDSQFDKHSYSYAYWRFDQAFIAL